MRKAVFTMAEGDVTLTFPDGISPESVVDLDGYLKIWFAKTRRDAGQPSKDDK
jgi:hypothetical protein